MLRVRRSVESLTAWRFSELHRLCHFSDTPCGMCGCTQRYTCNGNCVACTRFTTWLTKIIDNIYGVRKHK